MIRTVRISNYPGLVKYLREEDKDTLLPLEELDNYLKGDKLIKVLIDKDCRIKRDIVPTDIDYHVRKPSAREYDDCCNEFWNVTPYVIKGLCRKEILFAIDHFNQIVRHELLRMISWKVGIETGFKLSVGKNYKFIERYISEDLWEKLLSTYRMDSYENIWEALFLCHQLFRAVSGEVAERLHYAYPEYDRNITKYTRDMYKKYTGIFTSSGRMGFINNHSKPLIFQVLYTVHDIGELLNGSCNNFGIAIQCNRQISRVTLIVHHADETGLVLHAHDGFLQLAIHHHAVGHNDDIVKDDFVVRVMQ